MWYAYKLPWSRSLLLCDRLTPCRGFFGLSDLNWTFRTFGVTRAWTRNSVYHSLTPGINDTQSPKYLLSLYSFWVMVFACKNNSQQHCCFSSYHSQDFKKARIYWLTLVHNLVKVKIPTTCSENISNISTMIPTNPIQFSMYWYLEYLDFQWIMKERTHAHFYIYKIYINI